MKKFIKSILRKRGLGVYPYNAYAEKLEEVKHDWIKDLGIDTVFDVGASNGGFAKKIRGLLPTAQIHSFEPLADSYDALTQTFQNDENFKAYNLVISDKEGEVSFYQNDYSGSSSMLKMTDKHKEAYPFTKNEHKISVPSSTLDALFKEADLSGQKIMLKMDVQGAEGKVLEGGKDFLQYVDLILTEVSFDELYENSILFNRIFKMLDEAGFDVYGFENVSQDLRNGSFLQADAFFIRRILINPREKI